MSRLVSTSIPSRRTRWNRSTTSTLQQGRRLYDAVVSSLSSTSDMTSFHKTGCGSAKHSSKLDALLSPCTIFDKEKMKGDFLTYFKRLADKNNSKWQHVYMHFRIFTQGKCTFGEINVDLCNRFREYLLTAPQGLHKNRKLHINSAASYWSTFRASIHTAYRDLKIKENPNGFLERIETIPTDKEHLSQDEVIRLVLLIFRKQYYADFHLCSAM